MPRPEEGFKEGMETTMLLQTINKIGGLMRICFGEAGASIIARNLVEESAKRNELNLMGPGTKIEAIFGYCDIRKFTDTTECLQEEVMLFVNRIAYILHGIVVQCAGSANKNIGDAFLLTWKIDEHCSIEEKAKLADQALLSFCKTMVMLSRHHQFICNFSPEATTRLATRFPNYKVQIGCGLHVGWAIEGAIGSYRKIDASYLSPHVNMSEYLESSTKRYGVPILFSEEFYKLLSSTVQPLCRQVDRIQRKAKDIPINLYTYDADLNIDYTDVALTQHLHTAPLKSKRSIRARTQSFLTMSLARGAEKSQGLHRAARRYSPPTIGGAKLFNTPSNSGHSISRLGTDKDSRGLMNGSVSSLSPSTQDKDTSGRITVGRDMMAIGELSSHSDDTRSRGTSFGLVNMTRKLTSFYDRSSHKDLKIEATRSARELVIHPIKDTKKSPSPLTHPRSDSTVSGATAPDGPTPLTPTKDTSGMILKAYSTETSHEAKHDMVLKHTQHRDRLELLSPTSTGRTPVSSPAAGTPDKDSVRPSFFASALTALESLNLDESDDEDDNEKRSSKQSRITSSAPSPTPSSGSMRSRAKTASSLLSRRRIFGNEMMRSKSDNDGRTGSLIANSSVSISDMAANTEGGKSKLVPGGGSGSQLTRNVPPRPTNTRSVSWAEGGPGVIAKERRKRRESNEFSTASGKHRKPRRPSTGSVNGLLGVHRSVSTAHLLRGNSLRARRSSVTGNTSVKNEDKRPDVKLSPYETSLWETDVDLRVLRHKYTDDFKCIWDEVMYAYLSGQWYRARDLFREFEDDSVAIYLKSYIEHQNFTPPLGWLLTLSEDHFPDESVYSSKASKYF
eukprot:CAMPEP_0182439116 /NCGR_PEP_ID=MMETSP1167-20130531/86234_1 /TAXON_ID=2988 /ORGANISM="Mallomonas Sp, Strain CCMP3275" /LENGTH=845 /DNA_ID=CAMNT_0024632733 /DNA_START=352 /DNA_END=2889 /DNA_ORIENTATION=-